MSCDQVQIKAPDRKTIVTIADVEVFENLINKTLALIRIHLKTMDPVDSAVFSLLKNNLNTMNDKSIKLLAGPVGLVMDILRVCNQILLF